MPRETGIGWTDATFNPWLGCVRVSEGCTNCYAETLTRTRMGFDVFGPAKTTERKVTTASWQDPPRWNREAEQRGEPLFVFCASLADVFEDNPQLDEPRARLWELIAGTPWLTWLLLTKRPGNIQSMIPAEWRMGVPLNVWLGTSVEEQRWLFRITELVETPAPVHFLSCEPLLEDLELRDGELDGIEWVIVGGESGGKQARPTHPDWVRDLRDTCDRLTVAFFFKQWGSWLPNDAGTRRRYMGPTQGAAGKLLDGEELCERPPAWAPVPA